MIDIEDRIAEVGMNAKIGWALLLGFGIGAAAGLLLAPQSGEASRKWISKKARKGMDQASRAVEDAVSMTSDAIDKGKDRVADAVDATMKAVDATKKAYGKAAAVLG
jgi:gas vesicle protein